MIYDERHKEADYTGKHMSHDEFVAAVRSVNENNIILGQFTKIKNKIACKCRTCGYKRNVIAGGLLKGGNCAVCSNKVIIEGVNDMWTTRPDIAYFLKDPTDGYKHSYGSGKRLNWKCPDCKNIIYNKSPNKVSRKGIACRRCSDGVSIPNKLMANVLDCLKIEFETEKSFCWSVGKRYDFYLPNQNCIIEVHGGGHYSDKFHTMRTGASLDEIQKNDTYKKELAENNGIGRYIEIDARISEFCYIRKSIENILIKNSFDTCAIDWKHCYINTMSSKAFEAHKLEQAGVSKAEIAERLRVHIDTVKNYLQKIQLIENELYVG